MRLCVLLTICSALAAAQMPGADSAAASNKDVGKYTGPGSCASPSCHGSVTLKTETPVQQNEYSIWVVKDKHSRAYAVLSDEQAKHIGKILHVDQTKDDRCLNCHALNVAPDLRARSMDPSDGVSCESCHGPALGWLGSHTNTAKDTHEESVRLGMTDLRKPDVRVANCLRCHLGDSKQKVDHELIAAGHPDLTFEISFYEACEPKHWKEMGEKPKNPPDPWFDVRTLATGQAVSLREESKRLVRNAQQGGIWPEYAELDCFACHHSLENWDKSWQQQRGYPSLPNSPANPDLSPAPSNPTMVRRPGNPPWNMGRFILLRQVAADTDPGAARELELNVDRLYGMVSSLNPDRVQVAALANSTAEMADRMIPKLNGAHYDQAEVARMMKAIVNNADFITRQGERSAEESVMALQTLYSAYSKEKPGGDPRLQQAITNLLNNDIEVQKPSTYNGEEFSRKLKALGGMIP